MKGSRIGKSRHPRRESPSCRPAKSSSSPPRGMGSAVARFPLAGSIQGPESRKAISLKAASRGGGYASGTAPDDSSHEPP